LEEIWKFSSHIYSFFLFAVFLQLAKKYIDSDKGTFTNKLLLALTGSLILLVRPINLPFLLTLFLLDINSFTSLKERVSRLMTDYTLWGLSVIGLLLLFLPQSLYWNYTYGSPLIYSYEDESFTNLSSPMLLHVWFSTKNGLFAYSPILLVSVIGMITMLFRKLPNGTLAVFLFIVTSYIYSSWWSWHLGCSYGYRGFVEYMAILTVPFCFVLEHAISKKKAMAIATLIVLVAFGIINILMIYHYPGCWKWEDWNFNKLIDLI